MKPFDLPTWPTRRTVPARLQKTRPAFPRTGRAARFRATSPSSRAAWSSPTSAAARRAAPSWRDFYAILLEQSEREAGIALSLRALREGAPVVLNHQSDSFFDTRHQIDFKDLNSNMRVFACSPSRGRGTALYAELRAGREPWLYIDEVQSLRAPGPSSGTSPSSGPRAASSTSSARASRRTASTCSSTRRPATWC